MGYDRLLAGAQNETQKISSNSGCDGNLPETGLQEGSDFQWTAPFARQSWQLNHHQVPMAWTRSTGRGIRVMIIDTGLETDQENLNGSFNQGYSSGRTIESIVTLPRNTFLGIPTGPVETPDDRCGHGTAMAGVCVAPRGTDGNAVGVAYNSSLLTCRAASDVFLDESREVKGVADAFTIGANRTDVQIQSMSMGRLTTSSQIRDAIYYAVGKGKLIFCAAGTSVGWTSGWYGVIFPASLPVVQAVTGVYSDNIRQSCRSCHDGESVDFTVVMEKGTGKAYPLSTAAYGDMPSMIGGSSVATVSMAGMAAVVWSRFPTYNANQVLNQLVSAGGFYPFKHGSLGWGNVNLDLATR
jgi:subtilisin family serine protease